MKNTLLLIISSLILFFLTACVSVNIGKSKTIKSDQMQFQSPNKIFEKITTSEFDLAWRNQKTGNTIAVLSECGHSNNYNLNQLTTSALSALNNLKLIEEKELIYNDRAAIETMATGWIDGISVKMKTIVLQKNACDYTVSYLGVEKNFDQNLSDFNSFLSDFKIRSEAK